MPDPREVLPFLEVLLTALKKACDEISDPEARGKDALELAGLAFPRNRYLRCDSSCRQPPGRIKGHDDVWPLKFGVA